jgi:hypothetical protein
VDKQQPRPTRPKSGPRCPETSLAFQIGPALLTPAKPRRHVVLGATTTPSMPTSNWAATAQRRYGSGRADLAAATRRNRRVHQPRSGPDGRRPPHPSVAPSCCTPRTAAPPRIHPAAVPERPPHPARPAESSPPREEKGPGCAVLALPPSTAWAPPPPPEPAAAAARGCRWGGLLDED